MEIEVAARHGHLTPELHADILERAGKLVHYFERLTYVSVIADLEHAEKAVEIVAKCEHKHDFVGHASGPDVIAAMTRAMDKVKQQMRHHKERMQDHRHDPSHGGVLGGRP